MTKGATTGSECTNPQQPQADCLGSGESGGRGRVVVPLKPLTPKRSSWDC